MNKTQLIASSFGAMLVPVFEYFYGIGDATRAVMTAVIFFIVMDWLSGIRAAKKDNTYASKYGIDGVFRSFFMLLLPAGGHLLDKAFQSPGIIFGALSVGILYHVIQSMTANAIRAGWGEWLPISVLNWLIKWVASELDKKIQRSESRKETTDGKGL